MNIFSDTDKNLAAADIRELILSSGQMAKQLRAIPAEQLYGNDEADFRELAEISIELEETPFENLASGVDATACVLPDLEIRMEDRIQVGDALYRVQTVEPNLLFGVNTHQNLKLVRIHGR